MKTRMARFHRFGGPDVLHIEEVEVSMPDALQVLVSVKAAGVNPVDFKIRSGKYPAVKEDRLPYTPGRDVSGVSLAAVMPGRRCSMKRRPPANRRRSTTFMPLQFRWQDRLPGRDCFAMVSLEQDSRC